MIALMIFLLLPPHALMGLVRHYVLNYIDVEGGARGDTRKFMRSVFIVLLNTSRQPGVRCVDEKLTMPLRLSQ
jgi:hypothetical protein